MSAEFQRTIPGNAAYDPEAPKQPFWPSFFYVRAQCGAARRGAAASLYTPDYVHTRADLSVGTPASRRTRFCAIFAVQLNAEMLRANSRIDQRHHWDSVW